ncbi:MAG: glycosyl transferase [Clostridiales bacterium]|nr:glycosyl transferase [Clostridiales bacterium]
MSLDAYLKPLIITVFIIFGIGVLLRYALMWLGRSHKFDTRLASLSAEELDLHEKNLASEHALLGRQNILNWPVPRLKSNYEYIHATYTDLNEDLQKKQTVQLSSEWLLDNFYLIESQVDALKRELTKKSYQRLPVLATGPFKGYARVFAIAADLVAHTDGNLDEASLKTSLMSYQSKIVLMERELWAFPIVLRLAMIENIRILCEDIQRAQHQWRKANRIYDEWLKNKDTDKELALKTITDSISGMKKINATLIDHLSYRLRRSGYNSAPVLRAIDTALLKFGTSLEEITQQEHSLQSINTVSMGNSFTTLHTLATMDFADLIESVSKVDQILREDPDSIFPLMDANSRNHYRNTVEEIASMVGVSEVHIASDALELARQSSHHRANGSRETPLRNTGHVGYYLIGQGVEALRRKQGKSAASYWRPFGADNKFAKILYFATIFIMTLLMTALALWYPYFVTGEKSLPLLILIGLAMLIPASEIAINLVNWIVTRSLKPAFFPRLELKGGIPGDMTTMVVVPTLLLDPGRVKSLVANMEEHYLANREKNLYFTLVSAFRDSDAQAEEDDELLLETALLETKALNQQYAQPGQDIFFFCHRERQFDKKNNVWIGWERKRGALMEFNDLLLGSDKTSFTVMSNQDMASLGIQYIITLDSDTILPIGMARKLIGAMAHPLNRPVIDPKKGIVTSGYGLMQPRIDVDVESSNKSIFSKIFTDQGGIDPYANAISDVYQDLFGEGIFTGKGIYDLKAFQTVLEDVIPENTILSHDLLEGSFIRAALVSDLKFIDSFPSGYYAYSARMHRWIRGDWQLVRYLFPRILDRKRNKIRNPLSKLSRWKMFDNLRRSLVAPAIMLLAALSFSILPGSLAFWLTSVVLASQVPLLMSLINRLFSPWFPRGKTKRHVPQITGVKAAFLQGLLQFIFLPQQAALSLSAITITLGRVFFTKRNLLQWTPSAEVEKTQKNSLKSYIREMSPSWWAAAIVLALTLLFVPAFYPIGITFALLWASAPFVAFYVSQDQVEEAFEASPGDLAKLGMIARKTWRYFEEFSNSKNNYLIPDNYQENPPRGIAPRTSPTNIGLGLLAVLSARDFGYIGSHEMIKLLDRTLDTMDVMVKWNGHLYNWYDTRSLKPLRPRYVSTVDSGNLAGYLITLEQGLKAYLYTPLVDQRFLQGILDTLACASQQDSAAFHRVSSVLTRLDKEPLTLLGWSDIIHLLYQEDVIHNVKTQVWESKMDRMGRLFKREMLLLTPFVTLLPRTYEVFDHSTGADELAQLHELVGPLERHHALADMPGIYAAAVEQIGRMTPRYTEVPGQENRLAFLQELEGMLINAAVNTQMFITRYEQTISRVAKMSLDMKFAPLYVPRKKLFSLGYNIDEDKLTKTYYDLLASEARQTSYIAIARGEVPQSHWFKMGRSLVAMDGYKGLVSWSGTMFEYLMPLLLMKNYKNTLLDESYSFVIDNQKKYGKQRKMPWGVSESAFNSLDIHNDYQYKAIGVPWLGLKRGLIEDAVASTYSTFLALMVDPASALQNIAYLEQEGAEGPYGFYEALDYTPERLLYGRNHAIIKSYMAHHQGMSLLSINNFLHGNLMQERFLADREMHAARLLLWEKVPDTLLLPKPKKEITQPAKMDEFDERSPMRTYGLPDPVLPKVHILSNGNFSTFLTDRGTGFSTNKIVNVTRWREDRTLDPYGMFFYIRNAHTNEVWSAAYAPLGTIPQEYEVIFTSDKATYRRVDGDIETTTEVTIASADNVEFRRITLKNNGTERCVLDITSYLEVVLAPQAADVAHPAFSNLFVETSYRADKDYVLATRRPRSDSEKDIWLGSTIVTESDVVGKMQYETDRMQFLGRDNNVKTPVAIESGRPLSQTVGSVLDPVMSLRESLQIEPGKSANLTFVTALSQSSEALVLLLDRYATCAEVSQAFQVALARSKVETKYLGLSATQIEFFQNMLSDILFISPRKRLQGAVIPRSTKGQATLWQYGISGDLPIVLLTLKKDDQMELLIELLKAHEYWWLMGLKVDLVVISDEVYSYDNSLHTLILDIVSLPQKQFVLNRAGSIYVLNKDSMQPDDVKFIEAIARITLHGDSGTLETQMTLQAGDTLPLQKLFGRKPPVAFAPAAIQPLYLQYYNGLGGFSPDGNEYVIRLENDQTTPAPWVNVLANEDFGFIASGSGSGFTWHGNSRENKLTPWSNDAVSDDPGEAFYITDMDSGEIFTPTALPIRGDEPYNIIHGFGYTRFEHESHGISQKMTQFVPLDSAVKLSLITLLNNSGQKRTLTVTYYMRPVLGVSDQSTAMHIQTSVSPDGALLIENPYQNSEGAEICFIDVSMTKRWVTGDREEFFGAGDMASPDSLLRERLSGAVGTGLDPCGAMQVRFTLQPGESRELVYQLGAASSLIEVDKLSLRYQNVGEAKESLRLVKEFWKNKLESTIVKTPTRSMNLMLNGWLQYQVVACRLWARSAFYQAGGAYGYRDQLQDCLSVAYEWPHIARAQILHHARHQFLEGDVQHWWHEGGGGIRSRITDDRLWLPYVTAEYIRITGDRDILHEMQPFLEDAPLAEGEDERYSTPGISAFESTLYDHCLRAIEISLQFGEHGLPLMGTGDWNDGMNAVGEEGKGESVWMGWFLATVLQMFAPMCTLMGEEEQAEKYLQIRKTTLAAIEEHAWDGNWYRRAYFDDGSVMGSAQNIECKIDSISQTWAVISGGADPQRAQTAMNSLLVHLVDFENGLMKLLTPPFNNAESDPGYIKAYVPGVRENGGQYSHAAAWVIIAFAKIGDGDRAWELFRLINPIKHTGSRRETFRYKVEPYVMAADVYTAYPHEGRGGWTWYTGSDGWMYRAGLENILGLQKNADTMVMDPCIPRNWSDYELAYRFMDTNYAIKVSNPENISRGVRSITLDGILSPGNTFPLVNDGQDHEVQVTMGAAEA